MRRHLRLIRGLVYALGGLLLTGATRAAPDAAMQERLAPCIGCHGAGTSATEGVPSLGGQLPDYVVTQLFQFREKQREAPPMNEVAAGFSDDDLRGYADAVATLPPPAWAGPPADAALAARAQALVAKHQCNSCHGPDLAGRDAIPRIRAQREDYLAKALAAPPQYRFTDSPTGYVSLINRASVAAVEDYLRARVDPLR
ncbi:hypothetical protein OMR07_19350, partial [Methylobacterium organophilum]|nr:hypothetical protein [Methylobacterium organophilum]